MDGRSENQGSVTVYVDPSLPSKDIQLTGSCGDSRVSGDGLGLGVREQSPADAVAGPKVKVWPSLTASPNCHKDEMQPCNSSIKYQQQWIRTHGTNEEPLSPHSQKEMNT